MGMNGTGKLIKKCDLNKSLKLKEFTFEKFRHMCILSGCDYVSSLRGIGLKRAKQVVEIAGGKGMSWALQNIREILKMPTLIVPESYFENFFLADNTFQHQSVFDPISRKVVPLSGDASNDFFLSRREYPLILNYRLLWIAMSTMCKAGNVMDITLLSFLNPLLVKDLLMNLQLTLPLATSMSKLQQKLGIFHCRVLRYSDLKTLCRTACFAGICYCYGTARSESVPAANVGNGYQSFGLGHFNWNFRRRTSTEDK